MSRPRYFSVDGKRDRAYLGVIDLITETRGDHRMANPNRVLARDALAHNDNHFVDLMSLLTFK